MIRRLSLAALALAAACLQAQTPSPNIDVPSGAHLLMTATGDGAQIYTCTDSHWTLKAPDAKLLDANGKQIGTHFAGPTWKLNDGSEVKGKAIGSQPSPKAGSVAWLLVQAVPESGKGQFANVAYIRRTETNGGAAPKEACTGDTLSVPYRATYTFYTAR